MLVGWLKVYLPSKSFNETILLGIGFFMSTMFVLVRRLGNGGLTITKMDELRTTRNTLKLIDGRKRIKCQSLLEGAYQELEAIRFQLNKSPACSIEKLMELRTTKEEKKDLKLQHFKTAVDATGTVDVPSIELKEAVEDRSCENKQERSPIIVAHSPVARTGEPENAMGEQFALEQEAAMVENVDKVHREEDADEPYESTGSEFHPAYSDLASEEDESTDSAKAENPTTAVKQEDFLSTSQSQPPSEYAASSSLPSDMGEFQSTARSSSYLPVPRPSSASEGKRRKQFGVFHIVDGKVELTITDGYLHATSYQGRIFERKNTVLFGFVCGSSEPPNDHVCVHGEHNLQTQDMALTRDENRFELTSVCCMQKGKFCGTEFFMSMTKMHTAALYRFEETLPEASNETPRKCKPKKHYCKFCKKCVTQLVRHLKSLHKDQQEVKQIVALQSFVERNKGWELLRLDGDAQFNRTALECDKIFKRNPRNLSTKSVTCYDCKGLFAKREFSRHGRRCAGTNKRSKEYGEFESFITEHPEESSFSTPHQPSTSSAQPSTSSVVSGMRVAPLKKKLRRGTHSTPIKTFKLRKSKFESYVTVRTSPRLARHEGQKQLTDWCRVCSSNDCEISPY